MKLLHSLIFYLVNVDSYLENKSVQSGMDGDTYIADINVHTKRYDFILRQTVPLANETESKVN